jgi:RNA polymerase sigma factor (sigma-70 family)
VFLAIKRFFARAPRPPEAHPAGHRGPTQAGPPDDPPGETSADAEAERLVREALATPSPFVRDALYQAAAKAMITSAGPDLLRFCLRQVGDAASAEDIAQRALITFWQVLPRYQERSQLRTYLFGIAKNLCRRHARGEARAARAFEDNEEAIRDELYPELADVDPFERSQRAQALERALATLSAQDAWLLRARLVEELGYGEILPRYRARFGPHITTVEGLRTAFFHARRRLETTLRGGPR